MVFAFTVPTTLETFEVSTLTLGLSPFSEIVTRSVTGTVKAESGESTLYLATSEGTFTFQIDSSTDTSKGMVGIHIDAGTLPILRDRNRVEITVVSMGNRHADLLVRQKHLAIALTRTRI